MRTRFTARKAVTLGIGAAMATLAVPVVATPAMADGDGPTLVITKVVINPDGVRLDHDLQFTVAPNCNTSDDPAIESVPNTVSLKAGEHRTLRTAHPESCSVEEIAPSDTSGYHWLAPTYSSSTDGNTRTVTVTNTVAGNGDLTITKRLTNEDGVEVPGLYSVSYDCGFDFKHDKISGTAMIGVNHSEKVEHVPTGNVCTVSETKPIEAPTDYSWSDPTYSPASLTMVHDGGTIEVGNTISRDTGSLTITKTLNAGGSGFTGPFTVFYSCSASPSKATATIETTVTPGVPTVIKGIPTHQTCLVTENTPTVSVPGYTWSTPVVSGVPTAEMTKDGVTVSITNQLTAVPAAGGGGGGGAAAPAAAAAAPAVSVTPSPVALAPSATPVETPLPVSAVLPGTAPKPMAVNAGGGSAASDSSLPRWGIALLLAALVSVCVVAIRMQGSKSQ